MVNPLRQQLLLEYFREYNDAIGIPLHPTNQNFYTNLTKMIRQVDYIFSDKNDVTWKYFTLLISKWVHNGSMNDLIKGKIAYSKDKGRMTPQIVNREIENLFKDVNDKARFRYQNFIKCYIDILIYHYKRPEDPTIINDQLPSYIEFAVINRIL